jgi:nitrogen fixation protein NifU and related proteins
MSAELRDLYQEIILDHNKAPRNFRSIPDPDRRVEAFNPLCGDHYTIYLKLRDGVIEDVSFEGAGCAISKSSASIMTTMVKGKTKEQADALFDVFHRLVTGAGITPAEVGSIGKLAAFANVSEFPARVKCASLAWHTMHAAVAGGPDTVSTE